MAFRCEKRIMDVLVLFGMAALGLLGGLGSGGAGGDVVSFLPTDIYFQSRRIPLNIENLEDLARTEPKDGKAQILQLMALRALAEKPELIRKDPAATLHTIERIARGEIARDRLGFSEEYARRTLRALGGKVTPPKAAQPANVGEEALGWFPASTTLVGFLGGGPITDSTGDYGNEIRRFLTRVVLPPRNWNQVFDAVEMTGNARIDRISLAYAANGKSKEKDRFYVRITGKGDHQRIVAALKTGNDKGLTWKEDKDARGTPITTVYGEHDPAFALLGDTDLLLGTSVGGGGGGENFKVIQQLLAVRAGKEKSVLKGALQDRQPRLSPETVGLLVGDLPGELRVLFQRAKLPAPKSIRLEVLRAQDSVDVRFQATLENAEKARRFAESLLALRKTGLDSVRRTQQEIKDNSPLPRGAVGSLRKALESLQLQPDGAGVKGAISVPTEALLAPLWLQFGTLGVGADPPGPQVPEPEKKEATRLPERSIPGWRRITTALTIPQHLSKGGLLW
jgi:hypothetical protein